MADTLTSICTELTGSFQHAYSNENNRPPAINTFQLSGTQKNLYTLEYGELPQSASHFWRTQTAGRSGHLCYTEILKQLQVITLHMCHMNEKANIDASYNSLSETRFKVFLFLFRTAGIQLNMKSVSIVNFVCSATLILCYYITIACLFMDSYVNRHQLVTFMKKLRILITTQIITWIHISLR
jgi:hypothetical protein